MITIRINLLMTLVTLVVISFGFDSQYGVLAVEQKNSTDPKPESPLWQISSTQSSIVPISPSIATSTLNSRSTTLSSLSPPTSSVSSPTATKPNSNTQHNTARDEIYIDDEGLEGSGGRGEIHDDLEKEPEYSGSGFGPDDEDSTSSTTHQRKKGNAGYKSTNTGSGGYKPTNSKNKSQVPDTKANRQPETHEDDLESGSGDKDIDRDDEDQDVDEGENEDLDAHIPQPEEGEDNETGRSVGIPNVKTNLNTNGGEDEDDLTTTIEEKIEKTDGISSKLKYFNFDNKSIRNSQQILQKRKYLRNTFQSILILNSSIIPFFFNHFFTYHMKIENDFLAIDVLLKFLFYITSIS